MRLALLLIILVILIGALAFLSTQAKEVPIRTLETDVAQAPNAR